MKIPAASNRSLIVLFLIGSLAALQSCKENASGKTVPGKSAAAVGAKAAEASSANLRLEGTVADPDSLIRGFIQAVLADQGSRAYAYLPSLKEYAAIYPHMPDADTNPESPRMISTMLSASNQKELPRWIRDAEGLRGFSRFEVGPVERHEGYDLVTKVRIFVLDGAGKEMEFPIFRTLIKTADGYKIWLLLET